VLAAFPLKGSLVGRGGKAQGDGRARGEPGKAQGSQRTETGFTHDYGLRDTLDVRASETRELKDLQPPRNQMAQFNSNGLTLRLHACTSGLLGELGVLKTSLS
jgi:hypothetical protein